MTDSEKKFSTSFKAVIWDCDGCLIDSEKIACLAAAEMLTERGYKVTLDQFLEKFMGKGLHQILSDIDAETGRDFTHTFPRAELQARQKDVFTRMLKATNGIEGVLQAIKVPMAVASGSEKDRLDHTLGITKLAGYFKGHIYSAEMVKNGKPAPDIFLLAAQKLGVDPKDCLVIEDGIHGIHAAKAAGMTVYAYTGGEHMTDDLRAKVAAAKPDRILTDIRQLIEEKRPKPPNPKAPNR